MTLTNKEIVIKIMQERTLEQLCEYLDSCGDLFDLGYIDSQEEQDVLDAMTMLSALNLWAIHKYVNTQDVNYQFPFEWFVESLSKTVELHINADQTVTADKEKLTQYVTEQWEYDDLDHFLSSYTHDDAFILYNSLPDMFVNNRTDES